MQELKQKYDWKVLSLLGPFPLSPEFPGGGGGKSPSVGMRMQPGSIQPLLSTSGETVLRCELPPVCLVGMGTSGHLRSLSLSPSRLHPLRRLPVSA